MNFEELDSYPKKVFTGYDRKDMVISMSINYSCCCRFFAASGAMSCQAKKVEQILQIRG